MKKALYTAIVSMAFVVGMGFSNKLVFADEQVTTPQILVEVEITRQQQTVLNQRNHRQHSLQQHSR